MTSTKTFFQLSSQPEFLGGHVFWWWWWWGPHSIHYTIRECAWLKYFHLPVLAGRGGHVLQSWPARDIIECESWGRCHKGMVSFSQIPLLPWWLGQWKICPQCGRPSFNPWVRKILWRREWLPAPVFLSGESHGQRSLMDYNLWVEKSRTPLRD